MTKNTKLTAWDCMFGDSKWVDYFNNQKPTNSKNKDIHCMFADDYKKLGDFGSDRMSEEINNEATKNVYSANRTSKNVTKDLETTAEQDKKAAPKCKGKELGCKMELVWALKCPKCHEHHACHCRYTPVKPGKTKPVPDNKIDITEEIRNSELAQQQLEKQKNDLHKQLEVEREMREKILQKEKDDNDRIQQLIEERDKLLTEADEKKKRLLGDIEDIFDVMDNKITGVENLIRCIESYRYSLGQKPLNEARYQLKRSDSHPSVLCIRPPKNSVYNLCPDLGKHDCVRTIPDGETMVIHGQRLVNEDETLTICNIFDQILDREKRDKTMFDGVLKLFKCLNPFPVDIEEDYNADGDGDKEEEYENEDYDIPQPEFEEIVSFRDDFEDSVMEDTVEKEKEIVYSDSRVLGKKSSLTEGVKGLVEVNTGSRGSSSSKLPKSVSKDSTTLPAPGFMGKKLSLNSTNSSPSSKNSVSTVSTIPVKRSAMYSANFKVSSKDSCCATTDFIEKSSSITPNNINPHSLENQSSTIETIDYGELSTANIPVANSVQRTRKTSSTSSFKKHSVNKDKVILHVPTVSTRGAKGKIAPEKKSRNTINVTRISKDHTSTRKFLCE